MGYAQNGVTWNQRRVVAYERAKYTEKDFENVNIPENLALNAQVVSGAFSIMHDGKFI